MLYYVASGVTLKTEGPLTLKQAEYIFNSNKGRTLLIEVNEQLRTKVLKEKR